MLLILTNKLSTWGKLWKLVEEKKEENNTEHSDMFKKYFRLRKYRRKKHMYSKRVCICSLCLCDKESLKTTKMNNIERMHK